MTLTQEPSQQLTNTKCGCCSKCRISCLECWGKHHPRQPYFYTIKGFDDCFGEDGTCDNPGLGSKDFQGDNCECPVFCTPCNLIADIICCFPIIFGFWTVEKSN